MRSLVFAFLLVDHVKSMFITNSTISFKLKYPNLADLLDHYAPGVDASQYLSYGCNCHLLDNRPLASAGHGAAVDPIDQACKNYKDCQRCVQMDDGADCNVENKDWSYDFGISRNSDEAECDNPVKSCRRHLCECDKQFAQEIADSIQYYDSNFRSDSMDLARCRPKPNFSTHGNNRLRPDEIITDKPFMIDFDARSHIHESDARCCGPTTGPRKLYHVKKRQCCMPERKMFHLAPIGECGLGEESF